MYLQFKSEHVASGKNNIKVKGEDRFKYIVQGTDIEKAEFLASLEEKFRLVDSVTGEIIKNEKDFLGDRVELVKTFSGKFMPSRGNLSKSQSLAKKFPFMKDTLAQMCVEQIFGKGALAQSSPSSVKAEEKVEDESNDLP